jgi:hypothetical protein
LREDLVTRPPVDNPSVVRCSLPSSHSEQSIRHLQAGSSMLGPFSCFILIHPKCLEKPSEKALRCLQRRALQAYKRSTFVWTRFWPPYSGQITVGGLLESLFGQFLEGFFSEAGLPVYRLLGNWASGQSHSRKFVCRMLPLLLYLASRYSQGGRLKGA